MRTEIHTAKLALELLQKSIEKLEKSIEANNDSTINADQKTLRDKVIRENYTFINNLRDIINKQLNAIKVSTEVISTTDKFDLSYINSKFPALENSLRLVIDTNKNTSLEFRPYKKTIEEQHDKKSAVHELKNQLVESINLINLTTDEKRLWLKTIEKTVIYNENKAELKSKLKKLEIKQLQMRNEEENIKRELVELMNTNFANKEQLFAKMKTFIAKIDNADTKSLMNELGYPDEYFRALIFTKEFQKEFVQKHHQNLVNNIVPQITAILASNNFNYPVHMQQINNFLSSDEELFVGKKYIQEVMLNADIYGKLQPTIVKGARDNLLSIWNSTMSENKNKLGKVSNMAGVIVKLPEHFLTDEQVLQIKDQIIHYLVEACNEAADIKMSTLEHLQNLLTIKDKFAGVNHIVNILPELDKEIEDVSNKLLKEMNNNLRDISFDNRSDSLEKIAQKLNLIQQNISEFNQLVPGQLNKKLPLIANYLNDKLADINLDAQAKLEAVVNEDILNNKRITYDAINKINKFLSNVYGESPKEITALSKRYKDQYRNFIEVDISNIINNDNILFVNKIININSINEFMEAKDNLRIKNHYDALVVKVPNEIEILLADNKTPVLKKLDILDEMYKVLQYSTGMNNAVALAKLKEAEEKLIIDISNQLTNISLNTIKSMSIEEFLTNVDASIALKKIVDYSNNVGDYMMRNICEQTDPNLRKVLLERWMSIGEKCLAKGDIATAKAILTKFQSIAINFPITFNSLPEDKKIRVLIYGQWSESGDGWKKAMENSAIVGTNIPIPDTGANAGKLVGLKEANLNWNDSNVVSEICIPLSRAINRAKDAQFSKENHKTAKLLAQPRLTDYAIDNLRIKYENNHTFEKKFEESKKANDELLMQAQMNKKKYLLEAEGKIVKDKFKYATETGEYDQQSALKNYDKLLTELRSKESIVKQSMAKALTNEQHENHAFKFKSNLNLSSSLKPIDDVPLSQQELLRIINELKVEADLVVQKIGELKKRFFELPNEIENLNKKVKDGEKRFKILSDKKDDEMSSDEIDELSLLKEQKAQLTKLQTEKTENEQELKRLRPYEIKLDKEKTDQEKSPREKELDEIASSGKKSDLSINYSLESTLNNNSNFNSKQLSLIVNYYQFQEKIKKQEGNLETQKSSNYKYSFTAGKLSLLNGKYRSFDGTKNLDGFYQDYFVVKNGALYRRNLEERKQRIENLKDSTKTADRVAKLLTDVRDIVEIDIKKELTKEDAQYHNPPQSRVDSINTYFNIIDQKFETLINNMERKLAKEKHGYHAEYREAAREVLNLLIEERKAYQAFAQNVQAELKLITEDQFKLKQIPTTPPPIQQRNVQTEVRASPITPISKPTVAPIISPPNLVQPTAKEIKSTVVSRGSEEPSKKSSGFFSWFSKKEAPKHDVNTGMTKLLMSEGGSKGSAEVKQKATERLQAIQLEKTQETHKEKAHSTPINYVINTHQPNTLNVKTNIAESNDLSTLITKFVDDTHIKSTSKAAGYHLTLYCRGITSLQDLKAKIQLNLIPSETGAFHLQVNMHSVKNFDQESKIVSSIVAELKKQGIKVEKFTIKSSETMIDEKSLPHVLGITDIETKTHPSSIKTPEKTSEPGPQHVNNRRPF